MKKSETVTENIFRNFYGAKTFIEKSAIPSSCGFVSKKGTEYKGYPDFFKDNDEYTIIVEAKADDIEKAEEEVCFYMLKNNINKSLIGIAVAGQDDQDMKVRYFYKPKDCNKISKFKFFNYFIKLEDLAVELDKALYGDEISDEELTQILISLNNTFHDNKVRDTDRSLFFSGLMIALTNSNFRNIYKNIKAPTEEERASFSQTILDDHNLNKAILDAVDTQLKGKINNLSKEFSWIDRFSFIKTVDIPLQDYIEIIKKIEEKIYIPFKKHEKQDILGRAYRIFLKRAGKVDNKNIILTPDHIKGLMISLARVSKDDVVLDTCTGSGGFLMEAMERMISQCNGNTEVISRIKEKQLIGFETDPVLFSLACSNMFLHGDGRTNMLFRSSLISSSEQDKVLFNYVKSLKPTKIIINPPYENNSPIKFTKQAIDFLEPNGKLVIIMPSVTLSQNVDEVKELLMKAKLDYVIKMPLNIFKEQKRTVYTSIFGFTKTPHDENDEVLFCELKDDGLVSVQHKGRIDKNKIWPDKEKMILDTVFNKREVEEFSEKRKIFFNSELVLYGANTKLKRVDGLVKFSEIFNTDLKGKLQSESNNPDGVYDFITAAEEWKKHDEYQFDGEAIVYAVGSEGSLGRAHYVNGKFIASSLCLILTPKNNEKYPIDLEFYSYYLMAIRKQISSDLGNGTSKKTISIPDLDNYHIEYIPYKKQIQLKRIIKNRMNEFIKMKNDVLLKEKSIFEGITEL